MTETKDTPGVRRNDRIWGHSDALDAACTAIMDYVSVTVYGSGYEVGESVTAHITRCMGGEEATLFGHSRASPTDAALANDTFESIVSSPTSPMFMATLTAAEVADVTGQDALTGYVLGCDSAFHIGHAIYPHYEKEWHAIRTIRSFGAAAVTASVLRLDAETSAQALGVVASGSSSFKKNFGTRTPLYAGHAAELGVRAVLLADDGFTADRVILEEKLGCCEVMTAEGGYDPEQVTHDLGEGWGVTDIGFKPCPLGCHHSHRDGGVPRSRDRSRPDT